MKPAGKPKPSARDVSPQQRRAIVRALLDWFVGHARDLPWRRTLDPYAIWISEIMLQQTQVKTVIPYWDRWMRELPDAATLAAAQPEKVLKLWEGLGYYTRARNLQKAAQDIIARRSGTFPGTVPDILALPGIGRYTAGAISSIAFNQPTPIIDGNVIRVLTRLFGLRDNPREKSASARLWALTEQLVSTAQDVPLPPRPPHLQALAGSCSALNQALMELGATVCAPRQPTCADCPLAARCVAKRDQLTDRLPNLGKRMKPTGRQFTALVAERGARFLVRQRPGGVVNAHLWEFPNAELTETRKAPSAVARALGFKLLAPEPICVVTHSITRYRITLKAYRAQIATRHAHAKDDGRWCLLSELDILPFTSAHRRILRHLMTPAAAKV